MKCQKEILGVQFKWRNGEIIRWSPDHTRHYLSLSRPYCQTRRDKRPADDKASLRCHMDARPPSHQSVELETTSRLQVDRLDRQGWQREHCTCRPQTHCNQTWLCSVQRRYNRVFTDDDDNGGAIWWLSVWAESCSVCVCCEVVFRWAVLVSHQRLTWRLSVMVISCAWDTLTCLTVVDLMTLVFNWSSPAVQLLSSCMSVAVHSSLTSVCSTAWYLLIYNEALLCSV